MLVQRGYFSLPVKPVIKELQGFSSSIRSENQLPIKLNLTYERANGSRLPLTASMKIDRLALLRALPAAPQNADVELMGAVMDARGKPVGSFLRKVNVDLSNSDSDPTFKYLLRVLPGLYQVRVAAVDPKTKRMGEAAEWIEIPVSEP